LSFYRNRAHPRNFIAITLIVLKLIFFLFLRLICCSEMYKCSHEFCIKIVPDTSLHDTSENIHLNVLNLIHQLIHFYYYYRYSALGPVWAETRVQSGDWYGSGTLHPGQALRGSLPLLSPAFRRSHFRHQVSPRPSRRERS